MHRAAKPVVPRSKAMSHGALPCLATSPLPCRPLPVTAKHSRLAMQGLKRVDHRSLVRWSVSLHKSLHKREFSFQGKISLACTLHFFDGV